MILSPDKDMSQCVREDGRIVTYDRRKRQFMDADAVQAKFGVRPESIPDFLALVGDSADGYPGLPGWGAVSTATVLRRYPHLEDIPESVARLGRGGPGSGRARRIAEGASAGGGARIASWPLLRTDAPIPQASPDELEWRGVPREPFERLMVRLNEPRLRFRVPRWEDGGPREREEA